MQKIYKLILKIKSNYNSDIVFDTRILKKNDIFMGLDSKNNSGSLFYKEAIKKKASLILINKKISHPNIVYVKDITKFIKNFCQFVLNNYNGKIIAITGSVGKTTTKENIYHILKNNNFKVYRSYKNFNNLQGLQFSIMNLQIDTDYSVFELGINNPNEMNKLVKILRPHYCLITCIENSHIGNFKNMKHLIDNKLKIFKSDRLINGLVNFHYNRKYLKNNLNTKVKIINVESIKKDISKTKKKFLIKFTHNSNDVSIISSRANFYENTAIFCYLFLSRFINNFKSNVFFYENAIIDSRGSEEVAYVKGKKIKFYNHSYNANPYSLNKQILAFNQRNIHQKVFILGSMKELGNLSDFFHLKIIELVSQLNLKRIIFIGEEFYKFKKKYTKFFFYKNYNSAINYINKELNAIKNIFVMGSRSNQLEKLIKKYVK